MFGRKKQQKVVLELTAQEARFARSILIGWYNKLTATGKPTEDVSNLIVKLTR